MAAVVNRDCDVAVVGGGFAGLSACLRTSRRGLSTVLLEREENLGGLGGCVTVGGTGLERFYHHVFAHDSALLGLARELEVEDRFIWKNTDTGIYRRGTLDSLSKPLDLIRLPFFGLADKMRFALFLRSASRGATPGLDGVEAGEWVRGKAGEGVWREMVEPLVRAKFGNPPGGVSAAFLKGRFSARVRSRGGGRERLGYYRGGLEDLAERIAGAASKAGAEVIRGAGVTSIEEEGEGYRISWEGESLRCRHLVGAVPAPVIAGAGKGLPGSFRRALRAFRYRGAVCLVLAVDRPLSPYYWINVTDGNLPFTVVVEHTRLAAPEWYGGDTIVYLGAYRDDDDPLLSASEEKVKDLFLPGLQRIFPDFGPAGVKWSRVFRARRGSPVFTTGYGKLADAALSGAPDGLLLAGMERTYPGSRNIDAAIRVGAAAAAEISRREGASC